MKPRKGGDANSLHIDLARRIVHHIKSADLHVGYHLTEQSLAATFGTSRSPVRAALKHLHDLGALAFQRNRGYSVACTGDALFDVAAKLPPSRHESLYLRIASDRLAGKLPETVNETELMRRYDVSRAVLHKILAGIVEEGWIIRRSGYGWQFQPIINTPQDYEASYRFREAIEPAGILDPHFSLDVAALQRLTDIQQRIVEGGYLTQSPVELVQTNAEFHEASSMMSRNRFIVNAVRQQNRLRRLVEYEQNVQRERVRDQCQQHLQILDHLRHARQYAAADLLRDHLRGAREAKVNAARLPSSGSSLSKVAELLGASTGI